MKVNIVLIGMPGSGKTTLGRLLSRELSLDFIDIDIEIERYSQQKISQLFEKGEAHFRKIETVVTKTRADADAAVISTGGGVILRPENMAALKAKGFVVFLNRNLEDITDNLRIDSRPLLKEGVGRLKQLHDERIDLYHQYADLTIENNHSLKETLTQLIEQLPPALKKGQTNET